MLFQWYPGHMTKTKRMMQENIKLIDVVIELVDARVPLSSKNPDIDQIAGNKPRIILINKYDLADPNYTKLWEAYYRSKGFHTCLLNSKQTKEVEKVKNLIFEVCKERIERNRRRGMINKPIRAMIVGIPNVGKSTFINSIAKKASAKTGNRPGVTKGKQWIRINKDIELLDTPGILWPKFEDQQVALNLAFIGAIKDDILDIITLSYKFIEHMETVSPLAIKNRYKIEVEKSDTSVTIFEKIARKRGFIISGGEIDELRTAQILFDEFRGGKLGYISVETPENMQDGGSYDDR
ncbi:MAG: ribosome biogenesis GTPase YlqF [Clostridiales bacterium]|nr:ribosome biogenesis GTPase YlqF [Clostridiales bacterium]